MLSSVVSLSSSSKGFVGLFCIGAQVMLSTFLAGVQNTSSATRTTKLTLLPTKCVLSNGTLSNPYVAAMGYATVIFATLFFILRVKGFTHTSPGPPSPTPPSPEYPVLSSSKISPGSIPPRHNRSGMGSEPPSPPPDPGSDSADDTPRRNPWWLLLLLIAFAVGSYLYFTRNPDVVETLTGQIVSTMEQYVLGIWDGWTKAVSTARIYISGHGWQIARIILLALATHCICFTVVAILRRLRLSSIDPVFDYYLPTLFAIFPTLLIASSSQYRSFLWLEYHNGYLGGVYPSVQEINSRLSSYFSSLAFSHSNEISVIFGVLFAHAIVVSPRGILLIVYGFPSAIKAILAELYRPPLFCAVVGSCLLQSTVVGSLLLLKAGLKQYGRLNPTAKQHLWHWFSCRKSRESTRVTFLVLAQRHRQWKSAQIEDFYELVPEFKYALMATFKASLEIWSNMPIAKKLLIAAPAVIFYGYIYIMPVARSVHRQDIIPLIGCSSRLTAYTRQQSRRVTFYTPLVSLKSSNGIYPPALPPSYVLYPAGLAQVV
ncbi:hypothetical protein B0H16DRAFT_1714079 [Mycena metata]|uniref:Uncharacterized protein n=1 Tax=Mycena metata TaxID=1033252 RepID=A0AAD7JWB6_9AGAR|nr:hypothetical protein B0H16DRAFT_1714079 [Mycena metata]